MSGLHEYVIFALVFPIAIFGLFGNAMVIWAVRKYKDLKTKHGVLLCFVCFYQSMVLLLEVVADCRNLFESATTRSDCFYNILPLMFFSNLQITLLLIISVDLIFLVLKPMKYNKVDVFPYAYIVQAPCFVFALSFVISGVVLMDSEDVIACNIPQSLPQRLARVWNFCVVGICVSILCLYAATALVMWYRDRKNVHKSEGVCVMDPSMRYQRKMMRTLSVFMSVFFFTGFANALITLFNYTVPFLRGEGVYVNSYAAILNLIPCSQNYYVYNAMSKEFHKAFRKNVTSLRKWKDTKFNHSHNQSPFTVSGRRSSASPVVLDQQ